MSQRTSATLVAPASTDPRARHDDDDGLRLALLSIDNHGLIHARAEGTITAHDFPAGRVDPLEALLGANWKAGRVVIDFSSVRYVDSSAVGWLIGAQRAFREGGGRMVLFGVQPVVRQIFDVLKVGRVVPIAENVAAARELVLSATGGGQ